MNIFLRQARDGVMRLINESPEVIVIQRQPMVNDGFGGQVPDPFGTSETVTLKVRLSHERRNPDALSPTSAGLSTDLQRFITADYKADIREGDIFEAIGKSWQIGPVDPLMKFRGVTGYQAPLTEAS